MTMHKTQKFFYQDACFNIHHTVSENAEDPSFHLHIHNLYEIYCFLQGEGLFTVGGSTYKLESGMILFLRPGDAHSIQITKDKPYERICLHFDSAYFRENAAMSALVQRFDAETGRFGNCFLIQDTASYPLQLLKAMVNPEIRAQKEQLLALESNLPALLYGLSTYASYEANAENASSDRLVQQIIRYIDENLANDWSLDMLAAELYRDKAYLSRRFKSVVGTSIWDYTIQKRIIAAQRNIYRTGSVTEAFKLSGFKDYSTFFRNYQKVTGVSPSDDMKKYEEHRLI